jgi:hypothetical protein
VVGTLSFASIAAAHEARDPQFVLLFSQFVTQPAPGPDGRALHGDSEAGGETTFDEWLDYLKSSEFRQKSRADQMAARVKKFKEVEDPNAEVKPPDRLKAHEIIDALWRSTHPLDRDALLRVIAEVPLVYGPWRALKTIFKEAEAKNDTEVYGALAARFDEELSRDVGHGQVSSATLSYLARRAWRYLRRVALQMPAIYADVAVDVLLRYTDQTNWCATWVLNHIFYHETKAYGRSGFRVGDRKPGDIKHRAYGDLWKRSPRPLFTLLERAQSDPVREFAAAGLKSDFKAVLRNVEPAWVVRLAGVPNVAVHEFVVWILQNVPKFEQGEFRKLGLHEPVLKLLESPSAEAASYAAAYARVHARDLSVDVLVKLFGGNHDAVRKLARDLLSERDPRKDVGLAAWGRLLEVPGGSDYAAEVLLKAFGSKELTPDWFAERLVSTSDATQDFAKRQVLKVHGAADLGAAFFVGVVKRTNPDRDAHDEVAEWAMGEAAKAGLKGVPVDDLRFLCLYPHSRDPFDEWIENENVKLRDLGMDFVKMLAYQPDWDASTWLVAFKAAHGEWAKELLFDDGLASKVLARLSDVREFKTADLGLHWLLTLAGRSEPIYATFARDRMIRTLAPADFAPTTHANTPYVAAVAVDLKKKSFLFTGKLSSMQREEAEAKLNASNGVAASSVTKNLRYLVVGDDGSPLYGQGKKSSKQKKAEELNAAGANISIVSETEFLKMLSGGADPSAAAVDRDATDAGCRQLWDMVIAPGPVDAPLGAFAREYLRLHHKPIAQKVNNKALDPGTEVPEAFLAWDRFKPLLSETRRPLREFAVEFCEYNLARWNPPVESLVQLSENPFVDVRRLVAKSLLAEPGKDTAAYRIEPATLSPEAVYKFCESSDEETRALGMELIRRLPKLQLPQELFRLSESPDRKVRAFVIRSLWHVYRDRGLTELWKPPVVAAAFGAKSMKEAAKKQAEQGKGVPEVPDEPPAERPTLSAFLRRILFELPPGPPEKSRLATPNTAEEALAETSERQVLLKPIPARRVKLDAIQVMRDMAMDDKDFAVGILPLLDEFTASRGTSERAACLVAITRIRHVYPELKRTG